MRMPHIIHDNQSCFGPDCRAVLVPAPKFIVVAGEVIIKSLPQFAQPSYKVKARFLSRTYPYNPVWECVLHDIVVTEHLRKDGLSNAAHSCERCERDVSPNAISYKSVAQRFECFGTFHKVRRDRRCSDICLSVFRP